MKSSQRLTLILFVATAVLATAPRLVFFNQPSEVVFDEVYFGEFARSYIAGELHFDIHPPLGKLIVTGFAKLAGITFDGVFDHIGQPYSARDLMVLRLFPLLAGIGVALVVFLLALELTGSPVAAFLAGAMTALDNAFVVHSRYILLDMPLVLFGFLGFYLFLVSRRTEPIRKKHTLLVASGVALGAALSIKWTALAILGLILIAAVFKFSKRVSFVSIRTYCREAAVIVLTAFAVYVGAFAVHFTLLDQPGTGDAFYPLGFQEEPFGQKFIIAQITMFKQNAAIRDTHPYASVPNQWPLGKRPVFLWNKPVSQEEELAATADLATLQTEDWQNSRHAATTAAAVAGLQQKLTCYTDRCEIWLAGNPVVWLAALLALIIGFISLVLTLRRRDWRERETVLLGLLVLGWLMSYTPFALIARPLFLYHYYIPLIFTVLIFALLVPKGVVALAGRLRVPQSKVTPITTSVFLLLVAAGFLALAPLTYGIPHTPDAIQDKILSFLLN